MHPARPAFIDLTGGAKPADGPLAGRARATREHQDTTQVRHTSNSAADDLRLEVKGVGRITWPVASTMVRPLCAIAQPARYGLKTETRLDPRVRDTWEISKSRIRVDEPRWGKTFRPLLERMRWDLGLTDGSRLTGKAAQHARV